nr:polygalacturonase qrt3 [Quercus suber]
MKFLWLGVSYVIKSSSVNPIQEVAMQRLEQDVQSAGELFAIIQKGEEHNERVFNPIEYGADPTGTKDSSDAILKALGYAFQLRSGLELLPGISDFGGVVIDLQGGNYKISKPIRFPSSGGGNIVGILVQRGHETFISSCFLGQHSTTGEDKNERNFSGTAIDLASNDNAVTDVAIFSAAIGIVLRGQANILTGVHCYNKASFFGGIGILEKLGGYSQTRIDNCYLDYNSIVMEDPVQVHVSNGFFYGDATVVLKSIKTKQFSSGPGQNMVPIITLDGQFTDIDQVVIDRNNVNGLSLKSTVGKLRVAGNGTMWVTDFSSMLLFPNRISHLQYSFYTQREPKFTAHAVTNVSNNVVVVESETIIKWSGILGC